MMTETETEFLARLMNVEHDVKQLEERCNGGFPSILAEIAEVRRDLGYLRDELYGDENS